MVSRIDAKVDELLEQGVVFTKWNLMRVSFSAHSTVVKRLAYLRSIRSDLKIVGWRSTKGKHLPVYGKGTIDVPPPAPLTKAEREHRLYQNPEAKARKQAYNKAYYARKKLSNVKYSIADLLGVG